MPAAPARRAPELRRRSGRRWGRPVALRLTLLRRLPGAPGLGRRHPSVRPADAEFKWQEVTPPRLLGDAPAAGVGTEEGGALRKGRGQRLHPSAP